MPSALPGGTSNSTYASPSSVSPNSGAGAWQRTRLPHGHVASTTPSFSVHADLLGALSMVSGVPYPGSELRIVGCDLLRHPAAQQRQLFRSRAGGGRDASGRIKGETRFGVDLVDAMSRMHAFQAEAPRLLLPGKERLAGQQGERLAACRDELDAGHQRAPRVLFAEEDGARDH